MNKVYVFFVFAFFVIMFNITMMAKKSDYVVVIDPGHGGLDPGTLYGDIYEKDINLKISKYLNDMLKEKFIVIMTRYGDYDVSKPNAMYRKKSDFDNRIKIINNSRANLYISIHLNFLNDSRYYGAQVFYDKSNQEIANLMQQVLHEELNSKMPVKKIPSGTYMYQKLNVSGLLIECGFLSNSAERNKLITKNYQKKIAQAIYKGIVKIQNK